MTTSSEVHGEQPRLSLPSLLLLPAPPSPASAEAVEAAYRRPISATLSKLSGQHKSRGPESASIAAPVLVIAAAAGKVVRGRAVRWQTAQSLIARLYSIIAGVCAEEGIATDIGATEPGSVDARVIILQDQMPVAGDGTTVLDLAAFAATVHPWEHIYHCSGEPGYALLREYLKHAEGKQRVLQSHIVAVEGGLSVSRKPSGEEPRPDISRDDADATRGNGYPVVCLGGTFDHLHPGHKLFLHAAVLLLQLPDDTTGNAPCELVIGISSDELLAKKKFAEQLQSWDERACCVLDLLSTLLGASTTSPVDAKLVQGNTKELHATFRHGAVLARCVDFRDVYGPTVQEEAIEALVVSAETRSGGNAVNVKRTSQGWKTLDIYEIDVLDARGSQGEELAATNFASKISSTEIRKRRAEAGH